MDVFVKNTSFVTVAVVDIQDSIIWTDRYNKYGEFEIYTKVTDYLLSLFQEGHYLFIKDSDRTMVVESTQIKTDFENGDKLIVRGRSLESILDRRIIFQQTLIDGSRQTGIQTILNENVISSSQPARNIPNFIFSASADPIITALTLQAQYDGEGVYDVIENLCVGSKIGFKVILNSSNQFVFSLYAGVNRSHTQSTYPYVIFSPTYDNLIESDYFKTGRFKKTMSLCFGDAYYGGPRPRLDEALTPADEALTGLDRREIFVDAPDLSKFDADTELEIDIPVYNEQLKERGREVLREMQNIELFSGKADANIGSIYGISFFLGDIVSIQDKYGHSGTSRITEVTISENLSGKNIYPVFDSV